MSAFISKFNLTRSKTTLKIMRVATLLLGLVYTLAASAVCPVCTVAVSTGVGLSRWMGVDDLITGLWLGGLAVSLIYWTLNWMESRKLSFPGKTFITAGSYYLLIFLPLHFAGITGNPANMLVGVDKLILGIIAGSIAFFGGAWWYGRIKERHEGHAYFPFQKVLMPILPLIILSLIAYFLL